mgnify:CR=1 FL=1
MWHQVADKRPVHESLCWLWRPGWKRARKRTVLTYLHPKPCWEWLVPGGMTGEIMVPTDWWCDIDTPPDPPKERKL